MEITYDPAKNAANIERRDLPFDRIDDLDWSSAVIVEDTRRAYGERRYRVFGYLGEGSMPPSSHRAVPPCMSSVSGKRIVAR
ncbi:MAG: hypothetical protein OHM77_06320 [Candidatus Nitricoxidivorans perseverans]|uniref:BrnT family toxin n=1 Tax=Candidatus Nitricoxidivorans perseverans TaxID=2975601 RepID=A0AA49FN39_9PROT|nr:MAG: hypothetical protein OHM77_06320 [Candidatus Nitricoxidivorans perseverans]